MIHQEIRKKFIDFFTLPPRNHKEIPSAALVPENDPTVLFITAGMHPLVPFLLGEPHPLGKRLVDIQKSFRTDDIEEVGDRHHHTFFEMLGNWSLGDYFKKEAIGWSFEFLTSEKWQGLDPQKIYVSVFEGDSDAPRDEESIRVWRRLVIKLKGWPEMPAFSLTLKPKTGGGRPGRPDPAGLIRKCFMIPDLIRIKRKFMARSAT
ncbi:MAG: Alanine-tRNA ligase [Candidatus Gottesmanbacteria bacterium GW2011_GWC2_42_8]|nr:MAG: Alanine-tRNA ligase [Candidatus Gottesmanbacteria bacterium GW2011_GWC2_42_8]